MTYILAHRQQRRMRQRDHALVKRFTFRRYAELHVHRVGVADRNAVLDPVEVNLPRAPERVGAGLELAEVVDHFD